MLNFFIMNVYWFQNTDKRKKIVHWKTLWTSSKINYCKILFWTVVLPLPQKTFLAIWHASFLYILFWLKYIKHIFPMSYEILWVCHYCCSYKAITLMVTHQFFLIILVFFSKYHWKTSLFPIPWANAIHLKNNYKSQLPKKNHTANIFLT